MLGIVILGALSGVLGIGKAEAIELRGERVFAMNTLRCIRNGPQVEKRVALTFDDAPNGHTAEILAILDRFQVKATFFLIGAQVLRHPDLVQRIVAAGHEIGNHSFSHAFTRECPAESIKEDIERAEKAIVNSTGRLPLYFRPPEGLVTPAIERACGMTGYSLVTWSLDSEDWRAQTEDEIVERVLRDIHPGAIVLFHSLPRTVRALPRILCALLEAGYTCVPLSSLLE
ncbi:polysaccharide deacetylase family protein [Candidatus Caldatribacterium saccharofermentans]|uniref:polysaccharide deacetylase family protein n=1 Tax=Candidatus Caldatribacterium saccharofermentans TaxID=1454753 RepID=UPI0004B20E7A